MKIDGYIKRLLEKDFKNETELINSKRYIFKISDKCKATQLFKDNIEKYEDFKIYLKNKAEKENVSIVWAAYIHFLIKIIEAPTSIPHEICASLDNTDYSRFHKGEYVMIIQYRKKDSGNTWQEYESLMDEFEPVIREFADFLALDDDQQEIYEIKKGRHGRKIYTYRLYMKTYTEYYGECERIE